MRRYCSRIIVGMCAILFFNVASANETGGSSTGNSGDPWRTVFNSGKTILLNDILDIDYCIKQSDTLWPAPRWIADHLPQIFLEVTKVDLQFTQNTQTTCLYTQHQPFASVLLQIDRCNEAIMNSPEKAAELLAHEMTHHLGVLEEGFADQIASTLTNRNGFLGCKPYNNDTRFGALIYSPTKNRIFVSSGYPRLDQATSTAKAYCGTSDCATVDWIRYQTNGTKICIGAVYDRHARSYFSIARGDLSSAREATMANCRLAGFGDCNYIGGVCSDHENEGG